MCIFFSLIDLSPETPRIFWLPTEMLVQHGSYCYESSFATSGWVANRFASLTPRGFATRAVYMCRNEIRDIRSPRGSEATYSLHCSSFFGLTNYISRIP